MNLLMLVTISGTIPQQHNAALVVYQFDKIGQEIYTVDMAKKLSFKELDAEIGEKIKECRLEAGYSQTNLAKLLKYKTPTAISLIESGERSLKISDLIVLCQLFMKDYSYFIGKPSDHKHRMFEND